MRCWYSPERVKEAVGLFVLGCSLSTALRAAGRVALWKCHQGLAAGSMLRIWPGAHRALGTVPCLGAAVSLVKKQQCRGVDSNL